MDKPLRDRELFAPIPRPPPRPFRLTTPAPSPHDDDSKAEGVAAAPTLSVESMYQEAGGACGPGYELVVRKVLGASCECVEESCKDGAEGAREVRTEAERSFGKQDEPSVQSGGVTITFMNK